MITEEIQLDRKFYLNALETQPVEMRTNGVLHDCGTYCAVGLAASLVDVPLPESFEFEKAHYVYAAVQERLAMTDTQRDTVIGMNDSITYEESPDGAVRNVRYQNSWSDIADYLRGEWGM